MAEVFLEAREINDKSLPPVCVVCGQKGKLRRIKLVEEVNPVLSMFTRVSIDRMCDGWIPLCNRHERYFGGLSFFGLALLAVMLLFFATMACSVVFGMREPLFFLGGICCFFTVAAAGSFGHLFYRLSRTRPTEISKKGVRLINVSEEFVAALESEDGDD